MITINNLEEMKPYYNEKINTYIFSENNRLIDIKIDFDLYITSHIYARCINVNNIKALYINAWNIKALYINTCDINACNINAGYIKAGDINAWDINAWNINAWDINANDINAGNIKANNISFYAVCFARETFVCNSIKGRRENSKYFCLDSEVVIKSQKS